MVSAGEYINANNLRNFVIQSAEKDLFEVHKLDVSELGMTEFFKIGRLS